jgi:hypothetical protein
MSWSGFREKVQKDRIACMRRFGPAGLVTLAASGQAKGDRLKHLGTARPATERAQRHQVQGAKLMSPTGTL